MSNFISKCVYKSRGQKGEKTMYELSIETQEQINGGSALTYIVYALLGIAGVKLLQSKKGRFKLGPYFTFEWGR